MQSTISSGACATCHLAALRLLRFAEDRSPTRRRLGTDADALWKDFAGGLTATDRIDSLVRDADTHWPGAFRARATFGLRAMADDDAFGADWASRAPIDGETASKDAAGAPARPMQETLEHLCRAWELTLQLSALPRLSATSRILLGRECDRDRGARRQQRRSLLAQPGRGGRGSPPRSEKWRQQAQRYSADGWDRVAGIGGSS